MTRRRKILFVITKSDPWGGAQRYVYDLAINLVDSYDISVAFGGHGMLERRLQEKGIRTISLESLQRDINPFLDGKTFFSLLTLFWKERPDSIHLNSSKIAGLGALAGRLAFVPRIIFTVHGWHFKEDVSGIIRFITYCLSWLTAFLAHQVIVVSDDDARMTPQFLVRRKVVTIHNGVHIRRLMNKERAREHLCRITSQNIPIDKFWIGTVSELHPNKGLHYVVDGFAKADRKDAVLLIIGEGGERRELETLIRRRRVDNSVFLLGFIERAPKYMRAFDIFTLTSTKEGLPYVLLEAGNAELPVIATSVGGIPEVITHEETGLLVESKDSTEIAQALITFLDDRPYAKKMAKNLRKKVIEQFSIRKMIERTFREYHLL